MMASDTDTIIEVTFATKHGYGFIQSGYQSMNVQSHQADASLESSNLNCCFVGNLSIFFLPFIHTSWQKIPADNCSVGCFFFVLCQPFGILQFPLPTATTYNLFRGSSFHYINVNGVQSQESIELNLPFLTLT